MTISSLSIFAVLVVSQLLMAASDAATDFIDCNDPCNGGDVNYELTSSVRIMKMMNYTYKGRTFSREGDDTFMGPTMHVKPGQSMWIKFRNEMVSPEEGGANDLYPKQVEVEDYWRMLLNPGEKIKYEYFRARPQTMEGLHVDVPNMPKNFDATNLHLHGLDIEVHMFDPVNTHNPDAPHIAIHPGECYCYKFSVPDHHPGGMYWYHPHLHGATALQLWGGMLGLVYVDGPMEEELTEYGVTKQQEFVLWDPAFRQVDKESHNLEVDQFLMGQTTLSKIHPFLVNGEYNPTLATISVGEVLWLRVLSATIENENTFIVYKKGHEKEPWDESAYEFYVVATDGVTHPGPPKKKHIMVMAGGQRHEVLMQFDEAGEYVISQQGIEGMQFFDMYGHPHNQILATIVVTEEDIKSSKRPNTPIADMRFTPGYEPEEDIEGTSITKSETIVFRMGSDRDIVPFPQYFVNGKSFHPNRIDFTAQPGEAVEYILVNANHNVHPFHIHVNRFQVREMGSELSAEKYPVLKHVMEYDPTVWRDSVVVPPNGRARIWVQYKNYTGKTVFQ